MKVMAFALILRINKALFLVYYVFDNGIFIAYKAYRNDLHYWFLLDGVFGWMHTIFHRILTKTVADL